VSEPVWEDLCGHPEDGFIGTVWGHDGSERVAWDCYLFTSDGELNCCWRYGEREEQYVSPGSLRLLAQRIAEGCGTGTPGEVVPHPEMYRKAFRLSQRWLATSVAEGCRARGHATDDGLLLQVAGLVDSLVAQIDASEFMPPAAIKRPVDKKD
jgi:hypothetical protein